MISCIFKELPSIFTYKIIEKRTSNKENRIENGLSYQHSFVRKLFKTMQDLSEESRNELPPFLNTWKKMYLAVLANLVLLMLLFYWFTQYFQ